MSARVRRDFESNTDVPLIKGYGQAEAASASVLEVLVVGFPAPQVSASRIQHGKAVDADAGGVPIRDCRPAGKLPRDQRAVRLSWILRRHSQSVGQLIPRDRFSTAGSSPAIEDLSTDKDS